MSGADCERWLAATQPCISCGTSGNVATYVFGTGDGRLVARLLCSDCISPEPMLFADWVKWVWSNRRRREVER
jgi:hypothetical protein